MPDGTRYEPAIDPAAIDALDTHVHIEVDAHGHTALPQHLIDAAADYFRISTPQPDLDTVAAFYRERRMAAVVFTVDATTALRRPALSSADIAAGAARNNDVLIPFGSVDPRTPGPSLELARRLIGDAGVRGFKFHPTVQDFDPRDERVFPIYELLQEAGLPALFHTGQTGIGAGTPGGAGMRLGLSNPMHLDDVLAAFPGLQVIMAHPSVPWQEEAISVATHKSNAWIDLSGWSPKYFPAPLVRAANGLLQDRVLFGSDYPLLSPDRWLTDFAALELKPEVRPKILKGNALRLLGLS